MVRILLILPCFSSATIVVIDDSLKRDNEAFVAKIYSVTWDFLVTRVLLLQFS